MILDLEGKNRLVSFLKEASNPLSDESSSKLSFRINVRLAPILLLLLNGLLNHPLPFLRSMLGGK
jgi:hypothetical protein